MEPTQFQQYAEGLVAHGTFPAEFRSAISRAYYAVFHVGLNLLGEMGFDIVQNAAAHIQVYRHLNNSGDDELVDAAVKMGNLHSKRLDADYKLRQPDVEKKENAHMHVQVARRAIETMKRCCQGKRRSAIIESIRNWKRKIPS